MPSFLRFSHASVPRLRVCHASIPMFHPCLSSYTCTSCKRYYIDLSCHRSYLSVMSAFFPVYRAIVPTCPSCKRSHVFRSAPMAHSYRLGLVPPGRDGYLSSWLCICIIWIIKCLKTMSKLNKWTMNKLYSSTSSMIRKHEKLLIFNIMFRNKRWPPIDYLIDITPYLTIFWHLVHIYLTSTISSPRS